MDAARDAASLEAGFAGLPQSQVAGRGEAALQQVLDWTEGLATAWLGQQMVGVLGYTMGHTAQQAFLAVKPELQNQDVETALRQYCSF